MALNTPYATIDEADVYLESSVIWNATEDEVKQAALFWGRTFIDSKYSCIDFDEDAPPDEIKYANALLAEDYLDGTLLSSNGTREPTVKMKRVKAGSVETEKEFLAGERINYQQDVDALLSEYCHRKGGLYAHVTRI